MSLSLNQLHARVKKNRWLKIFTFFTRILLALAFLPSGLTKVLGNRFTVLGIDDPVGFFFEALYRVLLALSGDLPTHGGAPPGNSADHDARSLGLLSFDPEYLRHYGLNGLHRHTADYRADAVGGHLPALLGL